MRLFGLLIFAVAGLAAAGLVTYGIAGYQDWFVRGSSSFGDWASGSLSSGTAVLVGVGLFVLSVLIAPFMVPRRPASLRVLRQEKDAVTLLDLPSVAEAVESRLRREVDPTIGVMVKNGRLRVVTSFSPSRPFEIVDRAGDSTKSQLEGLGLADKVQYEVTTSRETKRRVL